MLNHTSHAGINIYILGTHMYTHSYIHIARTHARIARTQGVQTSLWSHIEAKVTAREEIRQPSLMSCTDEQGVAKT